jgi:hypothetical protein
MRKADVGKFSHMSGGYAARASDLPEVEVFKHCEIFLIL